MKDSIKEEALKEAGYEIVRFTDKQVLTDITNVISEIERTIECLEKGDHLLTRFSNPPPDPGQRGTLVHPQPPPAGDNASSRLSSNKLGK